MAKQEKENKKQKNFWKDFRAELKKVIWPTKKQLANNTLVVIAMVLFTSVVVLVLDLAFEALNTYGINKLKETVQSSISESQEDETSDGEVIVDGENSVDESTENQDTENAETNTDEDKQENEAAE